MAIHAFQKKPQKTARQYIELTRQRCRELVQEKATTISGKLKITLGSGNVFLDLGFGKVEAENLKLRTVRLALLYLSHEFQTFHHQPLPARPGRAPA